MFLAKKPHTFGQKKTPRVQTRGIFYFKNFPGLVSKRTLAGNEGNGKYHKG